LASKGKVGAADLFDGTICISNIGINKYFIDLINLSLNKEIFVELILVLKYYLHKFV
jgi:hypothetical protein